MSHCDIITYKKYIFGHLDDHNSWLTQLLNSWNFLNVESRKYVFCYVNEMTFGKHLRMGFVANETNYVIRRLELSVAPL